ncbi:hypothetical protein [Nonomuraea sp. NPDC050202]|uniref:hypothetical protein n=1 Tax=Nonomuraea sp. NPDC050202 TaxID=3155035 RepID=UPI0033F5B513
MLYVAADGLLRAEPMRSSEGPLAAAGLNGDGISDLSRDGRVDVVAGVFGADQVHVFDGKARLVLAPEDDRPGSAFGFPLL